MGLTAPVSVFVLVLTSVSGTVHLHERFGIELICLYLVKTRCGSSHLQEGQISMFGLVAHAIGPLFYVSGAELNVLCS